MIVTTYCTAQSLILQLISSDELLVLLWVSVIEVTVGAGGGPIRVALLITTHTHSGVNIPLATINSASLPSTPSPLPSQVIVTLVVTLVSEDTLTVAVELNTVSISTGHYRVQLNNKRS